MSALTKYEVARIDWAQRQEFLVIFSKIENQKPSGIYILESTHHSVNGIPSKGPLALTYFVQPDNGSRENRNILLSRCVESFVELDVSRLVKVWFLSKKDTHGDIDQAFIKTSIWFRYNYAETAINRDTQLSQTKQGRTVISHLWRAANGSGFCNVKNCLRQMDKITQYRYYKFTSGFKETTLAKDLYLLFPMLSSKVSIIVDIYLIDQMWKRKRHKTATSRLEWIVRHSH